jgi:arylamine N-acetyltransferase
MYTEPQVDEYLDHIGYPRSTHQHPLDVLAELQKRNLARIPFESVSLHYSKHRLLSLDLEDLFDKIVRNGRGGYCMEVNAFFGAFLRSLGFTVTSVGARVKGPNGYKGW